MLSDKEFRALLDHLDRPWAGYRKVRKGVKKRLRRHMQALGCTTVDGYMARLAHDRHARAACDACLRVTISRFFRDRRVWQRFEDVILPDLVRRFPSQIRIWSAGCACGEEPYSLAMLWSQLAPSAEMHLLASDTDATCLARAQAGVYPPSSLKKVPDGLRERYFESKKGGRQFHIRTHRLPPICWQTHDLLDPPPETEPFHLILLRNNLLTYYRGAQRDAALTRLLARLAVGGYLVIGAHERLPASATALDMVAGCAWVYRRRYWMNRKGH
jgi:chemotaxis methyl-accepting protein methylase